ncbi:MAG: imelysin family protein [Candidatus Sericytochromatia bacterium]
MFNPLSVTRLATVALAMSLTLAACGPAPSGPAPSPSPSASASASGVSEAAVVAHYAALVSTSYSEALKATQTLKTAVDAFVAAPSEAGLTAAKNAWLAARVPYGQTEGFRFADGPIDNEENGPEGAINAWPLDEVYIDSVEGQPNAGIVNNLAAYPTITETLIRELNEQGGDKNISAGYHAIEFLLWGQDLSEGPGAGNRPYTDFTTAANASRRADYLKVATAMLVADLTQVTAAWAPDQADNYRAEFVALPAAEGLGKLLKGIGTLSASELASERLATPLDIGDREEEHSCFSDNTHNDIRANAQSIRNVLLGSYTRLDGSVLTGPSLMQLLQARKPELATQLQTSSDKVKQLAEAVQAPFDQEIRPDNEAGHARVLSLVQALQQQGRELVEGGAALGIAVNTDL